MLVKSQSHAPNIKLVGNWKKTNMEFVTEILVKRIGIAVDLIPNLLDLFEERKILKNQFLIK